MWSGRFEQIGNLTELLLLDANVWVASGMPDNPSFQQASTLTQGGAPVAALDLTLYEVINVVAGRYRQPEHAQRLVQAILRTCSRDLLRVDHAFGDEVAEVVAEHSLTAYDAAYVAAARRNGWQLVSLDVRDLVSKGLAVTPDAAVYP